MKGKHIFEVITESYEEEQYLLNVFPDAWWDFKDDRAVFKFPIENEEAVHEAIKYFEELKKNEKS